MAGRRTNVALLALLPLALLTGTLAFGVGTEWAVVVVGAHAVTGLAIVALGPWKSMIIRRGLARRRRGWLASVAMGVLTVVVVATGLAHSAGARFVAFGITAMQVHVGAALALIPLTVWHAIARPARPGRSDLSRRALLRTAGVVGGAGLVLMGTEGAWRLLGTRGADRRFTGSHEVGSLDPPAMPVTQWLFDTVPEVDPATWRVLLTRSAGRAALALPAALAVEELEALSEPVRATIDCTGGWYATQDWDGVRLDRLLGSAPADAGSVLVRSVTGYSRRFPLADLDRLWLVTRAAGRPLSAGHGAPARLVATGRRGFWWVKWVDEILFDGAPPWAQPPFPLQ